MPTCIRLSPPASTARVGCHIARSQHSCTARVECHITQGAYDKGGRPRSCGRHCAREATARRGQETR
eukprot:4010950-Alexandrium_andersonii.AAC.1